MNVIWFNAFLRLGMLLFGLIYSHKCTMVDLIAKWRAFRNRISEFKCFGKKNFMLKAPRPSTSAKVLGLHESFFTIYFYTLYFPMKESLVLYSIYINCSMLIVVKLLENGLWRSICVRIQLYQALIWNVQKISKRKKGTLGLFWVSVSLMCQQAISRLL